MKKRNFFRILLFSIMYFLLTLTFQSCEPDPGDLVYKPNIYIYPTERISLDVEIDFPMGGEIVTSIPEYGQGWSITVDTNGLIDNSYSYLFYESSQPVVWQKQEGWIIEKKDLEFFFRQNMADYGFLGKEIDDFIVYWIPRLSESSYYSILPQTKSIIEEVIVLNFSREPDNILRVFYDIKGHAKNSIELVEPTITPFSRDGYIITEWGVIL